jgi:hypothetical protein
MTGNGLISYPARDSAGHQNIFFIREDGTRAHERRLTTDTWSNHDSAGNVINSASDANSPGWGRNNKIAFWSCVERQNRQVWTINPDATDRTQPTHVPPPSHNNDPTCSLDGRILFTTDRSGSVEMWIMDADGGNRHKIADSTAGPLPGYASCQSIR